MPGPSREITGEVVDERGRPVAGARVAAGSVVAGDSIGVAVPIVFDFDTSLQIVTTDAAGRFAIHDGPVAGAIVAQLGDQRSLSAEIADRVRLVLHPTRTVSGTVDLKGTIRSRVHVVCETAGDATGRYHMIAPIAADGSFQLAGVSVGPVHIGLSIESGDGLGERGEFQSRPASRAAIADVRLTVPTSDRSLDVIVRSAIAAPIDNAQVVLLTGKRKIANVGEIIRFQSAGVQTGFAKPMIGESVPGAALAKARAGDLIAHFDHASAGELTACAISFTGDLFDPAARKRLQAHVAQLALRCEQVGPEVGAVVVAVPPQQRFD